MKSARLFQCARCQRPVKICSDCDRGNIYCGSLCSKKTRALHHRSANQKYQATLGGRQKHAERQRRYRARQKNKVTDQGSPVLPPDDSLPSKPKAPDTRLQEPFHCDFCGELVSSGLRQDYLGGHKPWICVSSWPLGP